VTGTVATVTPMRQLVALGCVAALAALLAGTASSGGVAGTPPAACQTAEQRTHNEAVFGHFSSRAPALALSRRALKAGFKGIKIEDEGCGDYEVEIDGADKVAGRVSFAAEAQKAGYQVTFEQTGPPMQPPQGQAVGVFARPHTVAAANSLAGKIAGSGLRYVDIVRVGSSWAVVWPQVPVASALSIAAEVHKAGFRIAFIKG
jgi:hypothetical protein